MWEPYSVKLVGSNPTNPGRKSKKDKTVLYLPFVYYSFVPSVSLYKDLILISTVLWKSILYCFTILQRQSAKIRVEAKSVWRQWGLLSVDRGTPRNLLGCRSPSGLQAQSSGGGRPRKLETNVHVDFKNTRTWIPHKQNTEIFFNNFSLLFSVY